MIELLIVIAIIGILAAIAIPWYQEQLARAENKGAQTDVRNIMTQATSSAAQ